MKKRILIDLENSIYESVRLKAFNEKKSVKKVLEEIVINAVKIDAK